jgi:hypothetical protein
MATSPRRLWEERVRRIGMAAPIYSASADRAAKTAQIDVPGGILPTLR